MMASRRLLYVVDRCVCSLPWECALVSGNLIHCMVSVSQRWRMMAWSGGMAELGGVAMYHVGGM